MLSESSCLLEGAKIPELGIQGHGTLQTQLPPADFFPLCSHISLIRHHCRDSTSCHGPGLPPAFMHHWRVRNQRSNCQHPLDHRKIKSVPEKYLLLLYWLCQSLWLCRSQKNCEKFFMRWEYQTTWPTSWEICMQVRKQQLELDMEQQTGSKSGKEYVKAIYCHPA